MVPESFEKVVGETLPIVEVRVDGRPSSHRLILLLLACPQSASAPLPPALSCTVRTCLAPRQLRPDDALVLYSHHPLPSVAAQECIRRFGVPNCTFFHLAGGDASDFFLAQNVSNRRFEWVVEGFFGAAPRRWMASPALSDAVLGRCSSLAIAVGEIRCDESLTVSPWQQPPVNRRLSPPPLPRLG